MRAMSHPISVRRCSTYARRTASLWRVLQSKKGTEITRYPSRRSSHRLSAVCGFGSSDPAQKCVGPSTSMAMWPLGSVGVPLPTTTSMWYTPSKTLTSLWCGTPSARSTDDTSWWKMEDSGASMSRWYLRRASLTFLANPISRAARFRVASTTWPSCRSSSMANSLTRLSDASDTATSSRVPDKESLWKRENLRKTNAHAMFARCCVLNTERSRRRSSSSTASNISSAARPVLA
mmetsp:Transcript_16247/g.39237  ORF Transcript_16247/g.39237 Transcript_16247/m.39237 type:complete len:234 (-) Transcript_16247:1729-2430(-)